MNWGNHASRWWQGPRFKAILGEGAGDIHLYASFENFAHGKRVATEMGRNPEMAAWHAAKEAEPSSTATGPAVLITVFGDVSASQYFSSEFIKFRVLT